MSRIVANFTVRVLILALCLLPLATLSVSAAEKPNTLQADELKVQQAVTAYLPSEMLALLSEKERNWLAAHPRISIGTHHAPARPLVMSTGKGKPQGIEA